MKKYRAACLLTAFLTAVLSLCAGCGAGGADGRVTLRTVSMFGEGDSTAPAYQSRIESFQNEHQDVLVDDASEVSSESWKQGVAQSFEQEETIPDVIFYFTGADIRQMILNDQIVSVEEIREVYPDFASEIRESTMEFMKEFDGNHYAVPVKGFWEGLFCNQDLFEQYNAPLPADWESFERAVRIFSENNVIPVAASLKEVPHYWIEHLILSAGGAVEHRLNPKDYVPESWVEGIGLFRTLYLQNAFEPDTLSTANADATNLFLQKKAAMTLDGSWLLQSITDTEHTVVLPFPAVSGGKMERGDMISGFSSGFSITRKAWEDPEKRDAAVRFVSYMTSAESISALCAAGGAPAMDIEGQGSGGALQASVDKLQQGAKNVCMPIDSKMDKETWNYFCGQIPDVARGDASPSAVITEISKRNRW